MLFYNGRYLAIQNTKIITVPRDGWLQMKERQNMKEKMKNVIDFLSDRIDIIVCGAIVITFILFSFF